MNTKYSYTSTMVLLSLLGLICLFSPQPAIAGEQELIENFWHGYYGNITLPSDPSIFSWERLAKAKVDECYYGLDDPRNRPSFDASYPNDFTPEQVQACINDPPGLPKVNQAYVWGLAKSVDNVWFGTVANTLCLVFNGFYGPLTPPPMENSSWVCEMNFKDVRPPRIFMYNTKTSELMDMTLSVLNQGDPHRSRLMEAMDTYPPLLIKILVGSAGLKWEKGIGF